VKIGVIGGGAAGLASAWLLDADHDVTLFEKDDRLGGHAHTIDITIDGTTHAVDAGFQFFAASDAYATFNRLLDALDVPRQTYPATLTLYYAGGGAQHPLAMPPLRGSTPVWSSLTPKALGDLIRFRRFLAGVPSFLAQRDTTVTVAEYIERQRLPKRFVDDFLLPLLLAFWCVDRDDFVGFAAYNALYYLGANLPKGISAPQQSEIIGGLKVYVDALVRTLEHTQIRLESAVHSITPATDGWRIEDAAGTHHSFDHVILATNARQAHSLLQHVGGLEPVVDQLARIDYFDTTIAIHGDRQLMPRNESAWSVVNARWDGAHSSLSVWDPSRGLPVFKSWVTYDERMPQPLYATATYEHGKITPDYFDAQRELKGLHGTQGLWLAGLYMHDADSHESAVQSAVAVAERLSPRSARLAQLRGPRSDTRT
jgi:predicted NAD/FAD-binding protein